ncbi:MAG: glutaredoxin 3 [Anderseniella sp.]|nr:glutaredoxin 3 [Anderseniella sp.]
MKSVTIYSSMMCSYCAAAKNLLSRKGVKYEEIDVTFAPDKRSDMTRRAGGKRSVPQIFIGDEHVGGCDELHALEQAGKLDPMLKG